MLVNRSSSKKFKIMNSYFKKNPKQKWTWRSPNEEVFNEIDSILTSENVFTRDVKITNEVEVGVIIHWYEPRYN